MPRGVDPNRVGGRAGAWKWAALALAISLVYIQPAHSEDANEAYDPLYDPLYDEVYDEEFEIGPVGYPDPLERTNRGVFAFNRQVDKWILDPVTRAYQWAVPKPARQAIARMFLNLSSTKTIVNDLLQLEWVDAGVTTSRLVVNTTVGIAGLFDVAAKMGLDGHESDFGQTLALAGTPSGPYLVLPILGPSNVRDSVGTVVDGFFQPTYYIIGPADLLIGPTEIFLYGGGSGISLREQHYAEFKALQDSSIDFYAALRSGYYQDRVVAIWSRREDHLTSEEPILTIFEETETTEVADSDEADRLPDVNGDGDGDVSEPSDLPEASSD